MLSPSQERVRALGAEFAEQLAGVPSGEREALLARYAKLHGVELVLFDRDGTRLAGPSLDPPAELDEEIRRQPDRAWILDQRRDRRGAHPVFLVRQREPSRYWVGVHIPVAAAPEGRRRARNVLVLVTPTLLGNRFFFDWIPWMLGAVAAVLGSALCWLPLVRGMTRSIEGIQRAAGRIAQGHFDVRAPVKRKDELGDLGASIESMASHLARLVHGQRRFLADVAHELCAPLSRIQLSAGILAEKTGPSEREYVQRLERDVTQMSKLVGDLLSFTKGLAQKARLEPVPLALLVDSVVAQENDASARITLAVDASAVALADPGLLRRAVGNLIRNAIVYAGEAGPIHIESSRGEGTVRLAVRDQGPGLPDSELEAVFEPFYRPDVSRDRRTGGAGLGLSIVKNCVEACGGSVHASNRTPSGLEVILELPVPTHSAGIV